MAKVLRCRHIGPDANCQFKATGDTKEEILAQVAEHARDYHGIETVPPELVEKALAAIVDEPSR